MYMEHPKMTAVGLAVATISCTWITSFISWFRTNTTSTQVAEGRRKSTQGSYTWKPLLWVEGDNLLLTPFRRQVRDVTSDVTGYVTINVLCITTCKSDRVQNPHRLHEAIPLIHWPHRWYQNKHCTHPNQNICLLSRSFWYYYSRTAWVRDQVKSQDIRNDYIDKTSATLSWEATPYILHGMTRNFLTIWLGRCLAVFSAKLFN